MPWYEGPTIIEALDNLKMPKKPVNKPLRIPISDIYKIGGIGTVPCGRVISGVLESGMIVTFGPHEI